ncbi:hypothetical protein Tco_1256693 [Tanacetum coccineum]
MDVDLFTCDTPLEMVFNEFKRLSSMENDLFTYELGVVEDLYFHVLSKSWIIQEMVILMFMNEKYLKYGDHETMDKKIKDGVIATWFIQSYKDNSKITWKLKKQKEIYWMRGDDEEVLTDEELSDLEEENLSKEDEIVEIFRIETDIFDFETPLCEALKEFNYLFKIDVDDHAGTTNDDDVVQVDQGWFDNIKPMENNDDDIGDLGDYLILNEGMDISKITKLQYKSDRNGHKKRKSTKEAGNSKPKPEKSSPQSNPAKESQIMVNSSQPLEDKTSKVTK